MVANTVGFVGEVTLMVGEIMTDETAKAILAPNVYYDDLPWDDLHDMARLWLMRGEILTELTWAECRYAGEELDKVRALMNKLVDLEPNPQPSRLDREP